MSVNSKIAIRYFDKNNRPQKAVVGAEVYGLLAVNPGVTISGKPIRGQWAVSHVPTGLAIIRCLTLREARIALRDLALLKWPKSSNPAVVRKRKDLRDATIAVRDRVTGEGVRP